MTTLPDEIIFYIAQFIPDDRLREMLEVSRAFFQVALDARYREITLGEINDPAELKLLSHLL
jgi:hypothetical protein